MAELPVKDVVFTVLSRITTIGGEHTDALVKREKANIIRSPEWE